eukprot:CAMPEP_0169173924 /NCGR_PEP_ID=MMETSP1015-20121227/64192_1 /TAXON_ID=342587 /ORGANISM="Karlodinium micrum, Strain CCMP2283" /LENGTH=33 /DNA_ID= /DNA_START= /DNA_END= /DNA_ORIENTATION=
MDSDKRKPSMSRRKVKRKYEDLNNGDDRPQEES